MLKSCTPLDSHTSKLQQVDEDQLHCGGYSVADVQGNDGDADGGNQHEKGNKSRGRYVTNEPHWVIKHTWHQRPRLGCREGERLLQSLYPSALRLASRFKGCLHPNLVQNW